MLHNFIYIIYIVCPTSTGCSGPN